MGVDWSLREGYAWAEDKEHCEEYGRMLQADPNKVSPRAKKRGLPQVRVYMLFQLLSREGICIFCLTKSTSLEVCVCVFVFLWYIKKHKSVCLCIIFLKHYPELTDIHK